MGLYSNDKIDTFLKPLISNFNLENEKSSKYNDSSRVKEYSGSQVKTRTSIATYVNKIKHPIFFPPNI